MKSMMSLWRKNSKKRRHASHVFISGHRARLTQSVAQSARLTLSNMQIKCKRCDKNVDPITKVQPFNGGEHVRADCPLCGRWIQWMPKGTVNINDIPFERPTLESLMKLK